MLVHVYYNIICKLCIQYNIGNRLFIKILEDFCHEYIVYSSECLTSNLSSHYRLNFFFRFRMRLFEKKNDLILKFKRSRHSREQLVRGATNGGRIESALNRLNRRVNRVK